MSIIGKLVRARRHSRSFLQLLDSVVPHERCLGGWSYTSGAFRGSILRTVEHVHIPYRYRRNRHVLLDCSRQSIRIDDLGCLLRLLWVRITGTFRRRFSRVDHRPAEDGSENWHGVEHWQRRSSNWKSARWCVDRVRPRKLPEHADFWRKLPCWGCACQHISGTCWHGLAAEAWRASGFLCGRRKHSSRNEKLKGMFPRSRGCRKG